MTEYIITPGESPASLALRRDRAEQLYAQRLAEARQQRREDWEPERQRRAQAAVAANRAAEDRGLPFLPAPLPPLDPPENWLQYLSVEPVEIPPAEDLPRPAEPERRTAEHQLADAAKPTVVERMTQIVKAQQ